MCDHDHPWTFQNEKHKTDIENSYQGNPEFKISNADIYDCPKNLQMIAELDFAIFEIEYYHHIRTPNYIKDSTHVYRLFILNNL